MNDNGITPIILASGSPRRRELLTLLGLPFEVLPSEADESFPPEWEPERIASTLALRKAEAVLPLIRGRDAVIVGSDTIVVLEGRVLGKPTDESDARQMLSALQGRSHKVYTGVACIRIGKAGSGESVREEGVAPALTEVASCVLAGLTKPENNSCKTTRLGNLGQYGVISRSSGGAPSVMAGYSESKVTFRPMSPQEISAYIETNEPLDKAGSYGIQGIGSVFIEKLEGDFYSVMGLPLNLLYPMLLQLGVNPFEKRKS